MDCADIYYGVNEEGKWSAPVNLTGISGKENPCLVDFYVDFSDYSHVVYSKWTWGKDPSLGPGSGYQPKEKIYITGIETPLGCGAVR